MKTRSNISIVYSHASSLVVANFSTCGFLLSFNFSSILAKDDAVGLLMDVYPCKDSTSLGDEHLYVG